MKTGYVKFRSGYPDWTANLLVESTNTNNILSCIESGGTSTRIDLNHEFEFMLMGQRTFDNVTEEMGQASFDAMYPYGKIIAEEPEKAFQPVLSWASYSFMEYEFTTKPGTISYNIVSQEVKELLQEFNLPPHKFYPAKVTHEITKESRRYYILHVTLDYIENYKLYDWKYTESVIKRCENHELVDTYPGGTFKSYDDFWNSIDKVQKDLKVDGVEVYRDISFYCFEIEYDLVYAPNNLYLGPKLRQTLKNRFQRDMGIEWPNTKIACGIKTDEEYQTFLKSIGR